MNNDRLNDTVKEWLGAYLDHELVGDRLAWVEEHLAGCEECQKELEELRALSDLLQVEPVPVISMDETVFTKKVMSRLPRSLQPMSRQALRASLYYAPLALFGLWAFFQAALCVSSALLFTLDLFPQACNVLAIYLPPTGTDAAGWLGGILSMAGPVLPFINLAAFDWTGSLALFNIVLATLLALLFLAWISGLYSHRRVQSK
jgi:hypothetical protein